MDDGTIRVSNDDLKHIDKLTTCPCANCCRACSDYHELYSCKRRSKWVSDMKNKYYRGENNKQVYQKSLEDNDFL